MTEWREEAGESFPQEFQRGLRRATRIDTGTPPPPPPEDPQNVFDFQDPLIRAKLTDEGNGLRLASRINSNWIWLPSHGWHQYRNGAWVTSDNQIGLVVSDMLQDTQDIAAAMIEFAQGIDDEEGAFLEETGGRLFRWAHSSENSPRFDRIDQRARKYLQQDQGNFDNHDHLLVVKNGVVNLRTGELSPHDPDLFMTHSIPFDYVPDAPAPTVAWLTEQQASSRATIKYIETEPALPEANLVQVAQEDGAAAPSRKRKLVCEAANKLLSNDNWCEILCEKNMTGPYTTLELRTNTHPGVSLWQGGARAQGPKPGQCDPDYCECHDPSAPKEPFIKMVQKAEKEQRKAEKKKCPFCKRFACLC